MKNLTALILFGIISFAFIIKQTLQLGTPPKQLPSIDTALTKLTWNSIVAGHYKIFANDYNYHGDTSVATREITCQIFGAVYDWAEYDAYNNPRGFHKPEVYKAIVKKFYTSPTVRMALYKWVKPIYIEAFRKFPQWKKNIYKDMLQHAKKYISEFNYAEELKIYNAKQNFSRIGTKGRRGNYRRMETFIFRRVHNGDLTLQQMAEWVNIVQKDFNEIK